jgi:hypothetical protein
MADAETQITDDLLDAFVAEASANEPAILAWANSLLIAGSNTAAEALSAGFKAKVPLAGGAIGGAIDTAIASMDLTAEGALKTGFDNVIAQAKAKSLGT